MSSEVRKKLLSIEKNGVAGNAELTEVRSRLADIAKNGVPKEKTTVTGQSAAPAGSNARTQDSSLAKKREAARELYSAKQDMASAQEKLKKAQAAADQKAQMQESKRLAEAALAGYEPEVVTRGQWKMQVNDEETAAARAQLNEAFARKQAAQIKSAEAKAELDAKESPLQPVSVPTLEEAKYQGIGNKVAFAQQNKELLRTMAAAPTDIDSAGLNLEELSRLTYLTEQEAEVYSRYLQNRGEKAAADYLKLLERTINARISEEEAAKAKAAAKQNKALGVAGDVAMGYLTWTGAYEGARQALQNAATGEYAPIDPNAGGMRFVNVQNAIKEGLLEDVENPVGKKAAEIGLSALENVSRYPLGPLGMAAMTGGAAAQEMNTATREGATAEQALMKGVIAGAAEYVTEKMGMDRFTAALAGQARGQAVKFVLSTMVPEALEEAASEYINRVADNFIMGTASEMENYKKALMEEGMSEQEADRAAKLEFWVRQPLQAGIEGAISGGLVTGAGAAADATVGRYGRGKALVESGADRLLYDAVNSNRYGQDLQKEAEEAVAARQAEKKTVREQPQEGKKKTDAMVSEWNGREPAVTETEAPIAETTEPITERLEPITEPAETAEPVTEPRTMTKKEEAFQRRAEKGVVKRFADAMGVSRIANRSLVQEVVDNLAESYLSTGEVTEAQAQEVFNLLMEAAYVENTEVLEEYRELRDDLRKRPILISEAAKGDITDLQDIRRRTFGKLRLTSEKGVPLDSAYDELSTQYPHLFPEKVTGAADQLNQIVDALDAIYDTETSLADMNNAEWEEGAREAFNGALDAMKRELDRVKSSVMAREKQAERTAHLTEPLSAAEARELKRERERSRKAVEKVERRHWIGSEERAVVRDLLNGSRREDQIPPGMDEAAVMELYRAKKAGYEAEKRLKENKKAARAAYAAEAEEALHDFDRFKDKKSGLQYARETAERNIDDVVTDKAQAKQIREWMLTPVHRNEAQSTRRKNELREKVRALGLGRTAKYTVTYQDEKGLNIRRKVSESGLVQLFGEEKITEADLKSCGADVEKIKNARDVFRGIYDELLENANDVLVRNGYDPIEGRKNYFPHFSTEDGLVEKLGRAVGMKLDLRELPTEIAGRTDTFRPGKTWFGNFLERKGGEVTYDAAEGFDRYIEGIADVIYHTDDIQRLRAAEKELRYQFSEEGIKKQVQEIRSMMENDAISEEEGQHRIDDLLESGITQFPNLVTWLREYTDSLANKKSPADRNMEHKLGRGVYTVMKAMEGRVAANMIALNPGSWLTNFIPITQVSGMTDGASLLNAVADTVKSYVKEDGFRDKSDFLTNRRGSSALGKTRLEAAADLAGRPMELIDSFSSDVVTRALYYSGVKEGMSEAEAMDYANDMAARVMADRSKGAMPVIFHEKNPISKLLTMFQLEVNNQYSYFFKDVPRKKREEGIGALVMAFAKMFVGAYLYNELYERIVGRRAAFDPIDMVMDAFRSFSEGSPYEALSKTAKNAAEELPFLGGLLGGGRVPIQSALPDVGNVAKSAIGLASGEMDSGKARKNLAAELAKPLLYLVPPFGGGAVKKAYEGYKTVAEGGSFGMDREGQKTLRFPVEEKSLGNYAKAMVFGPYSMERAQEYVDSGFQSLSGKYTKAYEDGRELGIDYDTFRAVYDATRGVESDRDKDGNAISLSKSRNLKKAIDENTKLATRRQKEFLYEVFGVSSKVWEE